MRCEVDHVRTIEVKQQFVPFKESEHVSNIDDHPRHASVCGHTAPSASHQVSPAKVRQLRVAREPLPR